jgi:hypothetical protein
MPRSMLHATMLLLASGAVACSGWRHGASLYEYKDQVLKVDGGRGAERLRVESEFDSTIANWLAQNGEPDYIHVKSNDSVDLCYLAEDRVVTFTRPGTKHSIASIVEPIPEHLQQMFVHADRQRLAAQRGEESIRLATPAPAPVIAAVPVHEVPAAPAEHEVPTPIQPEQPPAAPIAVQTCPPCEAPSAAPAPQAAAKPAAKAKPAKPAEHAKPAAAPHDAPHK